MKLNFEISKFKMLLILFFSILTLAKSDQLIFNSKNSYCEGNCCCENDIFICMYQEKKIICYYSDTSMYLNSSTGPVGSMNNCQSNHFYIINNKLYYNRNYEFNIIWTLFMSIFILFIVTTLCFMINRKN